MGIKTVNLQGFVKNLYLSLGTTEDYSYAFPTRLDSHRGRVKVISPPWSRTPLTKMLTFESLAFTEPPV